ncbi:DUF4132 domain-containing protein [Methylosinus sp. LW4]|uniref:DUF4132 domain-containing protein n=1 Tax=Methylosinus sp. LW4 TaxID=136993 RepID=UPI00039D3465|nr:DUF4132 domain-containing protein [Methylosinus sp. LW4]
MAEYLRQFEALEKIIPSIAPGLASRLIDYVFTGEGASVLDEVRGAFQSNTNCAIGANFESIASFLAEPRKWRPDIVFRSIRVIEQSYLGSIRWRLHGVGDESAPKWLVAYVATLGLIHDSHKMRTPWPGTLTYARLRDLAAVAGDGEASLLRFVFEAPRLHSVAWTHYNLAVLPDLPQIFAAEANVMAERLDGLSSAGKAEALRFLARSHLMTGRLLDFSLGCAADGGKALRAAAVASLTAAAPDELARRLVDRLADGAQKERLAAVSVAMSVMRDRAKSLLSAAREGQKALRVVEEIDAALRLIEQADATAVAAAGDAEEGGWYEGADGSRILVPPMGEPPPDTPVKAEVRAAFDAYVLRHNAAARARNPGRTGPAWQRGEIGEDAVERLVRDMEGRGGGGGRVGHFHLFPTAEECRELRKLWSSPAITLWHIARVAHVDAPLNIHWYRHFLSVDSVLGEQFQQRLPAEGRDIRHAFAYGAQEFRPYLRLALQADELSGSSSRWDCPADLLWPALCDHFDLLDQALGLAPNEGERPLSPLKALDMLSTFPVLPKRFLAPVVDLAFGERKVLRGEAQALLRKTPGVGSTLIPYLRASKAEQRAEAATLLGRIGFLGSREALRTQIEREKNETVRASLLGALRELGEDISAYVSAARLGAEADAGLAKAKQLPEWMRINALPPLRLRDGTALAANVALWWTTLAIKLKQPGGNALLDLYLDLLEPACAEAFGLFALRCFVARDSERPGEAEANAFAEAEADRQFAAIQRWDKEATRERIFAMLRAAKLGEYLHSAIDEKGLLALATRVDGVALAEAVRAYLKAHYGRVAQCKALLECLAGNGSAPAVQQLLVVAGRYRQKTVQQLAGDLIDAVASRKGWTREELADRSVPTAGFDETGVLELPIGERIYTARLGEELKVVLFNPHGRPIQNLPASEEEGAADAKRQLSQTRKEVKQVIGSQTIRLHDAMCAESRWRKEVWLRFVLEHPVLGALAQRLIWAAFDDQGALVFTFRPLDDLSLTDANDAKVVLDSVVEIGVVHACALDEGAVAAWRAHLGDYCVEPLFAQLVMPQAITTDDVLESHEIDDRKGHEIEALKLGGELKKRGYLRGEAGDGGWFTDYVKIFPAAKIAVVLEFSGNSLPEENRGSALHGVRFIRREADGAIHHGRVLALRETPRPLLMEAWNDYHACAAKGSGFDPKWKEKDYF